MGLAEGWYQARVRRDWTSPKIDCAIISGPEKYADELSPSSPGKEKKLMPRSL